MRPDSTRRRQTTVARLFLVLVASTSVACGGSLQQSSSATFRASASPIESGSPITVVPLQSWPPILIPAASASDGSCAQAESSADPNLGSPSQPPKLGVPNGWPVMLGDVNEPARIAASGMSYLVQGLYVLALDPTGHEPAGWPVKLDIAPIDSSGYAPTGLEIGPDGTVYVTGGDTIEAFHPDGTPVAGWPYRASRILYPALVATLLPVAQGVYTDINAGEVVLLGKDGTPLPGWPVSLPNATVDGSQNVRLATGPDGTLYVENLTADTIYAYDSDGALKPGWPLQGWSSMTFDPSGRMYVWKYRFAALSGARYSGPAIETQIGAVDAAGSFRPGWPVKLDGPASVPTFGPDGTVYVTRGTSYGPGNSGAASAGATILALDGNGAPKAGWPISLPAGYWAIGSQPAVAQVASDPPVVTPNGTVYVIAAKREFSGAASGVVFAFGPDGRLTTGWPRAIGVDQLSNAMADAAGSGWLMAGSGGTVYLISENRILALQSDGTLAPGWPLSRPCGASPDWVEQTPDGGLLILWDAGAKPYDGVLEIRYRPDGSVAST